MYAGRKCCVCGVSMKDESGRFAPRNWLGHRSGKLTVARHLGGRDDHGYQMLELFCDCGSTIIRSSQSMSRARPLQSCGCGPKGRPPIINNGAIARYIWNGYKHSAKGRGYSFKLSESQIMEMVQADCYWCGCKPAVKSFSALGGSSLACHGIDRRDNNLGYTPENCVPCCEQCNRAKLTYSEEQFKAWVKKLYEHIFR